MLAPDLAALAVPVASLTLLPGNPRRGDVDAIVRSLARFGQRKPIVAKRDGTVVAGNHTLQAVQQLGWDEIAVVWVDDDEATAQAFALADNRTAELGGYDEAVLLELIEQVREVDPELLADAGWLPDAVAALEASLAEGAPPEALTDPDDVPEPPAEPVTKPGDLWLLGPHRVLAGDATVITDAERLLDGKQADCMWTDPPYGVEIVGGFHELTPAERRAKGGKVIRNDAAHDLPGLLRDAFGTATLVLKPGAAVYIAHPPGALCLVFGQAFVEAGWRFHETLVWVKESFVLGHADYHYRHEPMLFGYTAGEGRRGRGGEGWYGDNSQDSVFEVARPKRSETHPTTKPVELIAPALANSCPPGGMVLDLFGGSGSTLIAAHGTGRVAYLMELDPQYCDVICRRYQEHTGTKPILEATGEPYDFTRETEHAEPAEAG